MRTTVRLDDDLLRRAKTIAAQQDTTLTALIERGLRLVLASEMPEREAPARRGMGDKMVPFEHETAANEAGAVPARPREVDNPFDRMTLPVFPKDDDPYREYREKTGSNLPSDWLKAMEEEDDRERYSELFRG